MKFMYCKAQSSAALTTYFAKTQNKYSNHTHQKSKLPLWNWLQWGLTNILDFISCPAEKKQGNMTENHDWYNDHYKIVRLNLMEFINTLLT